MLLKRIYVNLNKIYEKLPKKFSTLTRATTIDLFSCGAAAIGGKNFLSMFQDLDAWGYNVRANPSSCDSEFIIVYFRFGSELLELADQLAQAKASGKKIIAYVIEPITFNIDQNDSLKFKILDLFDAIIVNSIGYQLTENWIYTKGFLKYSERIVLIEEPLVKSQFIGIQRKIHQSSEIQAVWHGHYRNMARWLNGEVERTLEMGFNGENVNDSKFYGNLKRELGIPVETVCGYSQEGHCDKWHPGQKYIIKALQQYDVGLAPFITSSRRVDTKPFGLKIFSYIMAGLPVIASPIPDYACWLQHEETCLFADSQSEWKEAAARLKSPELRQRLADNARSMMLCNFSHDHILGKYEKLFCALRHNTELPFLLKDI